MRRFARVLCVVGLLAAAMYLIAATVRPLVELDALMAEFRGTD